jgi:TfoX/Sxy family transcriptional regulator of competence genes
VPLDQDLLELLLDAADGLPLVEKKRMFGLQALWANGRIFALIHDGRIALKLPEVKIATELLAIKGSRKFMIGAKSTKFGKWFVTPEAFHDDPHALKRWTVRAHELALEAPLPKPRRRKRS